MKIRIMATGIMLILLLGFWGCQDYSELDPPALDPGEINPDVYVAIGNSLTAGYQNNALYESSQRYSFPALIANQLGIVDFEQPLISDPGIGGRLKLTSLFPPIIEFDPVDAGQPLNLNLDRPYNNLGIPEALLFDAIDDTDFQEKSDERNVFFALILRDQSLGNSVLEQALSLSPTLVTLWLGNIEILAYATSGGQNRQTFQAFPPHIFLAIYGQVSQTINQTDANVVVANIPDIRTMPFFTLIPPFVVDFDTNELILVDGAPVLWDGVTSPDDLVLLPALPLIQTGVGIPPVLEGDKGPLPPEVVLSAAQLDMVIDYTNRYNQGIEEIATDFGFALMDIHSSFSNIAQHGYIVGSDTLTTDYVTGGIISLDGIHPTSRGYAIIANLMIDVINDQWNANIPNVSVGAIPGSIPLGKKGEQLSLKELFNIDPNVYNEVKEFFK